MSPATDDAQASAEGETAANDGSNPPEQSDNANGPEGTRASTPPQAGDSVEAERDKLKEQLLRMAADFENYRRRSRREVGEAKVRGKDDAVLELLPVFDNLERAVAAADGAKEIDSVVEGVKMVLKLFEDTAERMGLKRVESKGERFDPAVHEAIQQQETDEHPPGTITQEVMPGYMFGQRLLRAAMVVVARPTAKPAASNPPPAQAEAQAEASEGQTSKAGSNAPQAADDSEGEEGASSADDSPKGAE